MTVLDGFIGKRSKEVLLEGLNGVMAFTANEGKNFWPFYG